jgi:hypothetical protein
MTSKQLLPILEDFHSLPLEHHDRELNLLEVAIYLEDSLVITLRDEEITAAKLGDPEALRRFALAKLGG